MRLIESYRVVVFIPAHAVAPMLGAVRKLIELQYGSYVGVSWTSSVGEERFTPLNGATPSMGIVGQEEVAPVCRVEFSLPLDRELLNRVIVDGIYPHHDWEEPVISVTETLDVRKT